MFVSGDTGLNPVDKTGYLQRESSGSNNLVYRKSNVADWAKWEIVPYGNYTIEDIEYIPYDGGSLDSTSVLVDTYTVDNTKSSVPIKRSRTVSTTVENTSTFSKTEGVTTTSSVSSDASVGLPEIGDILDFNVEDRIFFKRYQSIRLRIYGIEITEEYNVDFIKNAIDRMKENLSSISKLIFNKQ